MGLLEKTTGLLAFGGCMGRSGKGDKVVGVAGLGVVENNTVAAALGDEA